VSQTVRVSKEKIKFTKGFEKNWTLWVFRNTKVLRRSPRPVYQ
jgi:hypothetical protein